MVLDCITASAYGGIVISVMLSVIVSNAMRSVVMLSVVVPAYIALLCCVVMLSVIIPHAKAPLYFTLLPIKMKKGFNDIGQDGFNMIPPIKNPRDVIWNFDHVSIL